VTLLQQADRLLCESWDERMWADGEPIDPSPTIDQAVNGGFPWLEIRCSRSKTPSDVDLAAMKHPRTTFQPAALPEVRQGGPTAGDPATIGSATATYPFGQLRCPSRPVAPTYLDDLPCQRSRRES
jgi:hypothetical protein